MLLVFHLRSRGELMHLYWLIHPIPKRKRGKTEPWMILAVTRFAFKSNFFAGWCFSEKSAVKWQFEITVHWCSRVSSSDEQSCSGTRNCKGFFFFFLLCLFVYFCYHWEQTGKARGFKIQQKITESQRLVGLGNLWLSSSGSERNRNLLEHLGLVIPQLD